MERGLLEPLSLTQQSPCHPLSAPSNRVTCRSRRQERAMTFGAGRIVCRIVSSRLETLRNVGSTVAWRCRTRRRRHLNRHAGQVCSSAAGMFRESPRGFPAGWTRLGFGVGVPAGRRPAGPGRRGNRSGELLADDPQPRHAAVERGRLDAEALRRATAPADPPVRAVEHGADVIDFERGQRHAR